MDAMLDLPIIVILLVDTYFSWSVLPSRMLSRPNAVFRGDERL